MSCTSVAQGPPGGHPRPAGGALPSPLAARAAIAALLRAAPAVLALGTAVPGEAGTTILGRVRMPGAVPASAGKRPPAPSAAEAVVYVTETGTHAPKLLRRGVRERIVLAGDHFAPRVLPVVSGSKVRFENQDRVYHNVFSVSPPARFDLGQLPPGASREVRFEREGVIHLFCELHPAAAGFVVVCPNRYYTRARPSGTYALPPLPRGSYLVHAWHPDHGRVRRAVQVSGQGVVRLDLRF